MAHLHIHDLWVRYGAVEVLRGVSLELKSGQIAALLGANGSGKSSVLNGIFGLVRPTSGSVKLDGVEICGKRTDEVFHQGIVLISQARDLFPEMTVHENLVLGMVNCSKDYDRAAALEDVYALFPKLRDKRSIKAQALSGGEQQMIAIGRALVSSPRLMLLDEPSGGLAPRIVEEMADILLSLKNRGHTMLIVEQNIFLAKSVADKFYILRNGEVVVGDTIVGSATSTDDIIRSVYL